MPLTYKSKPRCQPLVSQRISCRSVGPSAKEAGVLASPDYRGYQRQGLSFTLNHSSFLRFFSKTDACMMINLNFVLTLTCDFLNRRGLLNREQQTIIQPASIT